MQPGQEVACGFFVACRDTSIMLDGIEETLDKITLGVECEVAGSFDFSVGFWRDDRLDGTYLKAGDEAVGIISLVAEQGFGLDLGRPRPCSGSPA